MSADTTPGDPRDAQFTQSGSDGSSILRVPFSPDELIHTVEDKPSDGQKSTIWRELHEEMENPGGLPPKVDQLTEGESWTPESGLPDPL